MSKYYFNGGIYKKEKNSIYEFGAVRPGGCSPYVTDSEEGIIGAEHHSSVYQISDDFKTAILARDNYTVPSPVKVELSLELQIDLNQLVNDFKQSK